MGRVLSCLHTAISIQQKGTEVLSWQADSVCRQSETRFPLKILTKLEISSLECNIAFFTSKTTYLHGELGELFRVLCKWIGVSATIGKILKNPDVLAMMSRNPTYMMMSEFKKERNKYLCLIINSVSQWPLYSDGECLWMNCSMRTLVTPGIQRVRLAVYCWRYLECIRHRIRTGLSMESNLIKCNSTSNRV